LSDKEIKDKDEIIEPQELPEEEAANGTEATPEEPEKSETELLREELAALNDRYLRLMAEYDNFRKRSIKEKDDIYPAATAAVLGKILPIMDAMERAAQFERKTEEFSKGFDMIAQNFKDALTGFGVEEVGQVGEEFNPNLHNAAMHIEDEELGKNVVSQVFQKGYKIGDRVIRYAMVQTAN
jgi:molecular chaperone GrpE